MDTDRPIAPTHFATIHARKIKDPHGVNMRTIKHTLPCDAPGTTRHVTSHHYGGVGARPRIYIQAALHADEIAGMLVIRQLMPRLEALEAAGRILGEIVVVPVANPIGLDQALLRDAMGRFELHTAENFNRHFPDLGALVMERLDGRLTNDPQINTAVIRNLMAETLAESAVNSELNGLRHTLLGLALDADMVLDLHCDLEALVHLYTTTAGADWCAQLSRYLGAAVVLLSDDSGGNTFQESCSAPWDHYRKRWGAGYPIPAGCQAATVELRGMRDVNETLADKDAANLASWLIAVGAVAGEAPTPPFPEGEVTPLAGTDNLLAPFSGILSLRCALGGRVTPGEVIADLIDPLTGERQALATRAEGLLYAHENHRFVRRGAPVAQVSGHIPIRTGNLLSAP